MHSPLPTIDEHLVTMPNKKQSCIRQKPSDLASNQQTAEKQVKWQFTTTNSGEQVRQWQSNGQHSSISGNSDDNSSDHLLNARSTSGDGERRKVSVYDTFRQKKQSVTSYVDTHPGWQRFLGIICVVTAGFVCVFASVASNYLLKSFSSVQVSFLRFTCVPFLTLPFLLYQRTNPFSLELLAGEWGVLIFLRGIIGSGNFLLRMATFERLPLGDATTILFTTPVFVGIMAKVFLGERYHTEYFLSTLLALFGCMLVSRPTALVNAMDGFAKSEQQIVYVDADTTRRRIEGTVAALLAAALSGLVMIIMRKIRKVEPNVILFHLGIIGTLSTGGWILMMEDAKQLPVPSTVMHWVWLLVMTFSSNVGLWLINLGLRFENANMVALLGAGDIVWAFLAQWTVFNVVPQTPAVAGATLIIVSVVLVALRKHIKCGNNKPNVAVKRAPVPSDYKISNAQQQLPSVLVTPRDTVKCGEEQILLPSPNTTDRFSHVINVCDEKQSRKPSAACQEHEILPYQNAHTVTKNNVRAKSVCVFDDANKMVMPCDSSSHVQRSLMQHTSADIENEVEEEEEDNIAAEAIGLSAVDGVTLNKFRKSGKTHGQSAARVRSMRTSTAW